MFNAAPAWRRFPQRSVIGIILVVGTRHAILVLARIIERHVPGHYSCGCEVIQESANVDKRVAILQRRNGNSCAETPRRHTGSSHQPIERIKNFLADAAIGAIQLMYLALSARTVVVREAHARRGEHREMRHAEPCPDGDDWWAIGEVADPREEQLPVGKEQHD